jgi:trk system potassium uptake protein TrkH
MATLRVGDGRGLVGLLPYLGYMIATTSTSILASGLYGAYLYLYRGAVGEWRAVMIYLVIGGLYLAVGVVLASLPRATLRYPTAIALTVLTWVSIPVLASIPFMLAARIPFVDALFESVSGWTTTGLTILSGAPSSSGGVYVPRVEELPRTLQVWRTLMQWEGGLGIVVFTIGVLAAPGISAAALYLAEGRIEKIEASVVATAWKMFIIYATLTGISASLFYAAGMNLYDAISHAMTGIATAGFSTHTQSIGYYLANKWVLIVGMLTVYLGAMNFKDHFNILTFRFRALKESVETQAQLLILALSSLAALYIWEKDPSFHHTYSALQVVFHVFSSSSTAGFQAGNLEATPDAYKALLTFLALLGGSAFSTAGGIKILRLVVLSKVGWVEVTSSAKPRGYRPRMRLGERRLSDSYIRSVASTATVFVLTHFILSVTLAALYPNKYRIVDAAFEVASAMGNVGLSVGISSATAPLGAKIDLILAMLLGRLEVVGYIAAIYYTAQRAAYSMRRRPSPYP